MNRRDASWRSDPRDTVQSTADWLAGRVRVSPRVALILGTGLGRLAERLTSSAVVPFEAIPHFADSTALGHAGNLVFGRLGRQPVVAMQGRCHFYEGYTCEQVTFPLRVMAAMGAGRLIVTNASGGLNPQFRGGDLMLISGHINLMGARTAVRAVHKTDSVRRTGSIYTPELIEQSRAIARAADFKAHQGVYLGVTGPCYETRAEYRAFRRLGADAVGMSTVPEVLAAAELGMEVLAISTITNVAHPDVRQQTDPHEVVAIAAAAEPKVGRLVEGLMDELASPPDAAIRGAERSAPEPPVPNTGEAG